MQLPDERITYLLEAYTSRTATASEEQELMEWMLEADENTELKSYMQGLWQKYQPDEVFHHVNWDNIFSRVMAQEEIPVTSKRPMLFRWSRVAAAAAAILVFALAIFFWRSDRDDRPVTAAENTRDTQVDRMPGHEGAILTLADGRKLVLDSMGYGKIASQNGGELMLNKGQLSYVATGKTSGDLTYNSMNTPKGRQFKLTLPDGTGVWLNSASSIRYPTAFTGKQRQVTITGEAYFEVAQNQEKPFIVNVNDQAEVLVLGTKFNVNAYQNKDLIKATLLEGGVRIQTKETQQILKPGQQAQLTAGAPIKLIDKASIEQAIAWKNGLFNFNDQDIRSVLEEIGRWYDMEIVYEAEPAQVEISGEMQRNLSLSQVMKVLKKLHINYRMEEKKLIIIK